MKIEQIVFLQDDNAKHCVFLLRNEKPDIVMDFLKQFHHPGSHKISKFYTHGTQDKVHRVDNYLLNYNLEANYVGLQFIIDEGTPFHDIRPFNGMDNWIETYYEIIQAMVLSRATCGTPIPLVDDHYEKTGMAGVYELAVTLTNKFEEINKGREWDGEFFDEIDAFMREQNQIFLHIKLLS